VPCGMFRCGELWPKKGKPVVLDTHESQSENWPATNSLIRVEINPHAHCCRRWSHFLPSDGEHLFISRPTTMRVPFSSPHLGLPVHSLSTVFLSFPLFPYLFQTLRLCRFLRKPNLSRPTPAPRRRSGPCQTHRLKRFLTHSLPTHFHFHFPTHNEVHNPTLTRHVGPPHFLCTSRAQEANGGSGCSNHHESCAQSRIHLWS